jgi:hypothetical protein
MTLDALSLRDMTVPFNHIEMALLARHPSLNISPMVETPAFDIDVTLRLEVAGGTPAHGTRKALLLPLWTGLVVVADETVGLVNGEVLSLDNLGMAGGTSQLHSPFQLVQMLAMGEGDILIDHVSPEILDLMASLLQTACIADLRMRQGRLFPRDEIGQRDLSVDPLPF